MLKVATSHKYAIISHKPYKRTVIGTCIWTVKTVDINEEYINDIGKV